MLLSQSYADSVLGDQRPDVPELLYIMANICAALRGLGEW